MQQVVEVVLQSYRDFYLFLVTLFVGDCDYIFFFSSVSSVCASICTGIPSNIAAANNSIFSFMLFFLFYKFL